MNGSSVPRAVPRCRHEGGALLCLGDRTPVHRSFAAMARLVQAVGKALRETGLALDRAGARLRGEYAFLEDCESWLLCCA